MSTARSDYTAADAERDRRAMARCPAASAYGDHLRRAGALPAASPVPILSPSDEVATGERELRRAMIQGVRL